MTAISMSVEDLMVKIWQILADAARVEFSWARMEYLKGIAKNKDNAKTTEEIVIKLHKFITIFPDREYYSAQLVGRLLFKLFNIEKPTKNSCFSRYFLFSEKYSRASWEKAIEKVNESVTTIKSNLEKHSRDETPGPLVTCSGR